MMENREIILFYTDETLNKELKINYEDRIEFYNFFIGYKNAINDF
jgi:hypothetical protein